MEDDTHVIGSVNGKSQMSLFVLYVKEVQSGLSMFSFAVNLQHLYGLNYSGGNRFKVL